MIRHFQLAALAACIVSISACDSLTGPENGVPDGTYFVSITGNPSYVWNGSAQGWVAGDAQIRLERRGQSLNVIWTDPDNFELGEPRIVQLLEDEINVHVDRRNSGFAYYAVKFTEKRCEASAHHSDRYSTYGIARWNLSCTIRRQ
jgi:hypothetical protein